MEDNQGVEPGLQIHRHRHHLLRLCRQSLELLRPRFLLDPKSHEFSEAHTVETAFCFTYHRLMGFGV